MIRFRIPIFNGGINEIGRPDLIGDGQMVECENLTLTRSLTLEAVRGGEDWGENNAIEAGSLAAIGEVKKIFAWRPRFMPDGALDESEYVLMLYDEAEVESETVRRLWLLYPKNEAEGVVTWGSKDDEPVIAKLYNPPSFAVTDRGLTLCDGREASVLKYIEVNFRGEIKSGDVGLRAPVSLGVLNTGESNVDVGMDSLDVGMGIPKGSILFFCYTMESEGGVESNPSPMMVSSEMNFHSRDEDGDFDRLWQKAVIERIRTRMADTGEDAEGVKYFNIYMASTPFTEGVVSRGALHHAARIPVKDEAGDNNYVSTSAFGGKVLSWGNDATIKGDDVCYTGGVTFVSNANSHVGFAFEFRWYWPIKLINRNSRHYAEAAVWLRLKSSELKVDGETVIDWNTVLPGAGTPDEKHHLRLFDTDMTTMLPVIYKKASDGSYVDVLVKIPYMSAQETHVIYLCYGGVGVPPAEEMNGQDFRTAEYGDWMNMVEGLEGQKVVSPSRVRSNNDVVTFANEEEYLSAGTWDGNNTVIFKNRADENIEIKGRVNFRRNVGYEKILGEFKAQNELFSQYDPVYMHLNGINRYEAMTISKLGDERPLQGMPAMMSLMFTVSLTKSDIRDDNIWANRFALVGRDTGRYVKLQIKRNGDNFSFRMRYRNTDVGESRYNSSEITYNCGTDGRQYYLFLMSWEKNNSRISLQLRVYTPLEIDPDGVWEDFVVEESTNNADRLPDGIAYRLLFEVNSFSDELVNQSFEFVNTRLIKNAYITSLDSAETLLSCLPYFPEEHVGFDEGEGENVNVSIDDGLKIKYDTRLGMLRYSSIGGITFPVMNYLWAKGRITRIMPAPSYLQTGDYQNCVVVFGEDFRQRMLLRGTPAGWQAAINEILVDEKVHFGLSERARETLLMVANTLYWVSGNKLMRENMSGMVPVNQQDGGDILRIGEPGKDKQWSALYDPVNNEIMLFRRDYDRGRSAEDMGDGDPEEPMTEWAWVTSEGFEIKVTALPQPE